MNNERDNYFNIPHPHIYKCEVWYYKAQHPHMYILASKVESGYSESPRNLFFRFETVHFYDGPLWWPGANFSLATANECIELWRKVHHREYAEKILRDLAKTTPLFIVNVPSYRIRILADKARIDDSPPQSIL